MSAEELDYGWPVARKRHQCSLCGHAIPPGQRYRRASVIFDGDFNTWKTHGGCEKLKDYWIDLLTDWSEFAIPEHSLAVLLEDSGCYPPKAAQKLALFVFCALAWENYGGPEKEGDR